MFQENEREYSREVGVAQRKLQGASGMMGERKRAELHDVEKHLERAERYLTSMEREARNALTMRGQMEGKVRNYNEELRKVRRDLDRARHDLKASLGVSAVGSSRRGGGGGGGTGQRDSFDDDYEVVSSEQRTRLLSGEERIDAQRDRLGNIYDIGVQNEDIGVEILGDLHEQRETLIRARDKLDDVDDNMNRARSLLKDIACRAISNKLLLIAVNLLLLGAIGLTLYLKLK
jgi:vesicle transport through interaction with t-SNAREs 1